MTHLIIVAGASPRTGSALVAPGHAHGAATVHHLDRTSPPRSLAPTSHCSLVTQASPVVLALPPILAGNVTLGTVTLVATNSVETLTRTTQLRGCSTLVHILTFILQAGLAEAIWTRADKCPDKVLAAIFAVVGLRLTFIDIATMSSIWSQLTPIGTDTSE